MSKPFVYALALPDRGLDAVVAHVGAEPTGDPFNSITVDERTGAAARDHRWPPTDHTRGYGTRNTSGSCW